MSRPRRSIFCGDAERRPATHCRDRELVGRDSGEPEGSLDLIIYHCALSSRTPNAFRGEGPHNRGLTCKRSLRASAHCWRGPSLALGMTERSKQEFSTSPGMTAELSACAA